jgi:hypothetical protein
VRRPAQTVAAGLTLTLSSVAHDVDHLTHEVAGLTEAVERLVRGEDQATAPAGELRQLVDQLWFCERCGKRVAVMDVRTDVIRFKYKDLFLHVKVGTGGWVQTPCLSCGHLNVASFTPG